MIDINYHISVEFYAEDVHHFRPEWSIEKCSKWLDANEESILREAEEAGVHCMEDLLGREEPE